MLNVFIETYQVTLTHRRRGGECFCTMKVLTDEPGLKVFVREVAALPGVRAILATTIEPIEGCYQVKWKLAHRCSATVNIERDGIPLASAQVIFFLGDERIQSAAECKVIATWNMVLAQ